MRIALPYAGGELEATLDGDTWVVRLGMLEESSQYLDYALSRLLDTETRHVHHLAMQLTERLLLEAQIPDAAGAASAEPAGETT
jgi:hypothetical protein